MFIDSKVTNNNNNMKSNQQKKQTRPNSNNNKSGQWFGGRQREDEEMKKKWKSIELKKVGNKLKKMLVSLDTPWDTLFSIVEEEAEEEKAQDLEAKARQK